MTTYPLLGSPEFFAACREADMHITAGDNKKPVIPRTVSGKPKEAYFKPVVPQPVKDRVINLKLTQPKLGKAEIQAIVFRETGVYFTPSMVSQWWCIYKKSKEGKSNVKPKTRQAKGAAGKGASALAVNHQPKE